MSTESRITGTETGFLTEGEKRSAACLHKVTYIEAKESNKMKG
jgi:hypothetical protein